MDLFDFSKKPDYSKPDDEEVKTFEFPAQHQMGNKKLEEKIDIKKIEPIVKRIVQFLMEKSIHEHRRQDKANITSLGGSSFWIEYKKHGEPRLCFSKHPQTWDIQEIIREITEREADMMMEKYYNEQVSMQGNPFTNF